MSGESGRCLCGAVRFVAQGVEHECHACHCGMCRRWSGGAPFLAAMVASVTFEGSDYIGRYTSSEWAERGFCRKCGTTLFYFLKPAQTYAVSIGTFDDGSTFKLAREICIDRKPETYALEGNRPRLTEAEAFAEYSG